MALDAGTTLGRYKIRSPIGAGGMGEVYLAEDTSLDRTVALKVLPAPVASDQQRMRRFIQEAKAASGLNHPNILTVYEIGQADSTHFIATEFIEGVTLRRLMTTTLMALGEMFDIAIQSASALAVAHAAGIVHRDIKPENIMLRTDGYVKVLDFGLAKLADKFPERGPSDPEAPTAPVVRTDPGVVMGTVFYMSPEQARGLEVDGRSDVWSLGVVLYEMFAGRAPFEGPTGNEVIASILNKEPPPLTRFAQEVPTEFQRIVNKALAKDREERYQTIKDLLIDLKNLKRQLEFESKLERFAQPESGADKAAAKGESRPSADSTTKDSQTSTDQTEAHPISSAEYLISEIKLHKKKAALLVSAILIALSIVAYYFIKSRATIDSVAVLPFVNMSGDPGMEDLGDGITDSMINNLKEQLPGLRVVPRSTMFRYKGQGVEPQKVARDLNVRAVLMGRVVKRGDTLIVQTELVDADYDSQIWGGQYSRNLSDLFGGASLLALQEEISKQIIEKLRAKLQN
ncbi:MAG TPA: serine/threonine-protein kinase [Pyrinomonadaceae bacterium]|nr:serine/threonine-protein kinase [Pyrinomonadaceae bacterium]